MANWRKQGDAHRHVPHWRSSSFNRKPPLDNWHPTVPSWEKKFCTTVGSIPWGKLKESKKYMYLHENVVNWDDSAGKEAFDNAKSRFWAEYNGLPCNLSLPDPNIYIDDVDWNSSVDPELLLDLEREVNVPSVGERDEEVVIIGGSLFLNQQPLPPTGWGDDDDEVQVPIPSAAQGWGSNLREDNGVDSWEQHCAPLEQAREYEWQQGQNDSWGWNQMEQHHGQNDSWGWNQREQHHGQNDSWGWNQREQHHGQNDSWGGWNQREQHHGQNDSWGWNQREHQNDSWEWNHREQHYGSNPQKMSRGRNGGYGNLGTWDGYTRKRENMSWSRNHAYIGDGYQMNRGRRNYRGGGRRGNFAYEHRPYVDKVPTPAAW